MIRSLILGVTLILPPATALAQSSAPATSAAGAATEHSRAADAVAALQRAIEESPRDASLHQQLSQAYAILDQPRPALEAIEQALALSPDSIDYLRARAILATWAGDYDRARDSYRRLDQVQPADAETLLNLARVSAWGGHTDDAVDVYRRYLRDDNRQPAVWIELAMAESWRGNFAAALDTLQTYKNRFGADEQYARSRAALLARAGRPADALDALAPILTEHPDDYEMNLARAIALAMQRRAREAGDALDVVRRLQPNVRDTRAVEGVVRTVLASSAEPGVSIYGDSSGLEVQRFAPRGTVRLSSGTTLSAALEHELLRAPAGSDLAKPDGSADARHDHIWASAAQQVARVNVRGRVGRERTLAGDRTSLAAGFDLTPIDGLKLSLESSSGYFVVSPRTIGLGLTHRSHRLQFDWSPTIGSQVVVDAGYGTVSDGNLRWDFTASPRYGVARTQGVNLDLGGVVALAHTRTNYNNGYYDPSRYEYYGAAAFPYFKISSSAGLGLSLTLGAQRDDFSPSYRLGGNALADATFGIYSAWALKVSGGWMLNQRLGTGAFRGHGATVSLIRRF